jgi:thioesterase domain-containing protein
MTVEGQDRAAAQGVAAERLGRDHFALATPLQPPATETERRLLTLWQDVLDIDGLGVLDDFFELGGDSFLAVALFTEIDRLFGRTPPLSALLDCPTVRQLAERLDRLRAESAERPVIAIRTQGTRPPLFVIHAVSGHVLFVRRLASHLDASQPVYAIQARGIEEGETPHDRFDRMAADYVAALRRVQPHGPYFLAGYCIGGVIAFEVALQLRAAGEEVALLTMIDPDSHPNVVPWLYWRRPWAPHIRAWRTVIRVALALRRRFLEPRRRGAARPPLTPQERIRQAAIRAGILAAIKIYRPRPYDGRLVVFCATERLAQLSNRAHGWGTIAPDTEFHQIGRRHRDIFYDALPALGRELQSRLDTAQVRAQVQRVEAAA